MKDPSSQQYTLTLSRELPSRTVVDVSYLGNHGRHFAMPNININTLDPSYYSLGSVRFDTRQPVITYGSDEAMNE